MHIAEISLTDALDILDVLTYVSRICDKQSVDRDKLIADLGIPKSYEHIVPTICASHSDEIEFVFDLSNFYEGSTYYAVDTTTVSEWVKKHKEDNNAKM